jgi:hypothetical protein
MSQENVEVIRSLMPSAETDVAAKITRASSPRATASRGRPSG